MFKYANIIGICDPCVENMQANNQTKVPIYVILMRHQQSTDSLEFAKFEFWKYQDQRKCAEIVLHRRMFIQQKINSETDRMNKISGKKYQIENPMEMDLRRKKPVQWMR